MKRAWLLIGVAMTGTGVATVIVHARDPIPTHHRREKGECSSCHEDAPRYHTEARWDLTHGRAEPQVAARCGTCHSPETCTDCHARPPTSHTEGFLRPTGGRQADLHTVLGHARPSSCIACHQRPLAQCAGCHSLAETRRWQERATAELERWMPLMELPDDG